MKVIIPTFNRSAKLSRTLECYSVGDYNIEKMVVIDGSSDEHRDLNERNCSRLGFEYLHFDPELNLAARLHEYLTHHCNEELVCLGSEEDVFSSSYIDHSEGFLLENVEYSSYIGRYITLGKPLLGINRLVHGRDFITSLDLSNSDPTLRLIGLLQAILVGSSPVFFAARRRSQLLKSLEAQMKVKFDSTQELVDQVYLALSGKIRFDKQPMLLRDETNIGYKFYESRHDPDLYITPKDIKRLKALVSHDFEIKNLDFCLNVLENMWSPMDDKDNNSTSIPLARHKKYYSSYENFEGQTSFEANVIRTIAKIGIVLSEFISWPLTRRVLNLTFGKSVINKFSKLIPTHAVYK
jgi:hypothetical protein